jgi:type II secretory pathway predicted ATPase ExeA
MQKHCERAKKDCAGMYENFYGLSESPFQLTPDARFFYESTVHRQAMSYLTYGLHHGEGFIVITGEVGAGKTILVDNLLTTINQKQFRNRQDSHDAAHRRRSSAPGRGRIRHRQRGIG